MPPTPTSEIQNISTMSPPKYSSMESQPQKPCAISNLMSPPEPAPLDSYTPAGTSSEKADATERRVLHQPLSPPVSPCSRAANTIGPVVRPDSGSKDPILYPATEPPASAPTGPLFMPVSAVDFKTRTERLVDEHIASRPASLFREASPPKREDYELALYFKSNCLRMFQANPQQWLRQERGLLEADRKHRAPSSRPIKLPRILPASKPKPAALGPQTTKARANRVQKPDAPKARAQKPRAPAPVAIHAGSPEPRVRTVAPSREDKDFMALEDLSPPLSSLANAPKKLRVCWKENVNPLDLSNDPHRHLLHPDELTLASNLRLDCATYLTCKRRIFLRRLEFARDGQEFRKTHAQKACKVDVNKASRLWQAYDEVGWLDIEWIRPYMNRAI
ncbi:uncharacterized protein B0T15DRAFT_386364 [Chaetomium strumarium]|uniref:SWIRM domain-containing protein n=1 Tax=Chaetomium strumarium TaxID=1170767 RepID=A0AAJ0H4A0_9PEZI|nr:hypothetical protein B0T15DRAFT_386364 [Chaetomium strumarium]